MDDEGRDKLIIIVISILSIILIVILALFSFPSILISTIFGSTLESNPNLYDDLEKVAIYQDVILEIDRLNQEWIEDRMLQYSYCDEFEVSYDYDLTWRELMAIDSVLYRQDFRKINKSKIAENALVFMDRNIEIIEREYSEPYSYVIGTESGPVVVSGTRVVKRKVGIITISTRAFNDILPEFGITDEEDIFMATNIYDNIVTIDIEGNLNIYDRIDLDNLEEYPEGYANIPYYNQTDIRWATNSYGNSTIYSGGCGPTSLAMVVSGLTGRTTPDIVADWSYRNGHRAEGQGSYWSLMTDGGAYYGLQVEQVSRRNPNKIVQALSEGYPVIASMGPGHFTRGGHFIVLRGITADGKILVHDSASVERSKKEWDLSIIMNESSKNGGVNGSPFWIFKIFKR